MANMALAKSDVTVVANNIGPIGGMERQLTELISGLLSSGHRVTVISWTCSLPPHSRLCWIRVPGPSRPFAVAYPLFFMFGSMLLWLHGRGVVHSTGAIVLNRTSVCTVHFCHRAAAELSSFSRASRSGILYWLNEQACKGLSRLAERWCYRPGRTRHLVGVSEGVARELRRHFPKMRNRIAVIPNGVDTDVFRPRKGSRAMNNRGALEALFVGSEWRGKGLRVAIEALDGCPDLRLTIVGKGNVKAYRELAMRLGVDRRVKFVSSTTDVASWYRRAEVFLLPTAYETFSLVTYEAAASGLPLLVTKVNGVEDLLREGANGWFIDRNAASIRRHLRKLQSDPERRAAMGREARKDSLRFSWSLVVDRYSNLYQQSAARSEAC